MKHVLAPCLTVLTCMIFLLYWQQTCLEAAKAEISRLQEEKAVAVQSAADWKLVAENARFVQDAQARQAQACLEREAAAAIEVEHWQTVMAQMQTRELEDEEKIGVPDDATRRALLESLDRPW